MNRRNLLTAVGASVMLPDAVRAKGMVFMTTPSPDADLIRVAEQFIANEQAPRAEPCDAEPGTPEEQQSDWRNHQMVGVQRTLTLKLETMRATTADGIAVRARCLAVHNADFAFSMEDRNTTTGSLVRQLIRDAAPVDRTVTAPPSPDAALLQACAEFDALERAYLATFTGFKAGSPEEDAAGAEQERLHADQEPLVDRICDLRAVTREGQAARARSLALWDAESMKSGQHYTGDRLMAAIVRDLLA